jgi:hypothetical protein
MCRFAFFGGRNGRAKAKTGRVAPKSKAIIEGSPFRSRSTSKEPQFQKPETLTGGVALLHS